MGRLRSRVDRLANKAIPMKNQMLIFRQITYAHRLRSASDTYCCDLGCDKVVSDAGESLESFRERVRHIAAGRRIKILAELCITNKDALC